MKNKKFIFGFILGMLVMGTTAYAAYKYHATEVGYTPSNANFDVDNVSDAIKELYEKYENGSSSPPTDILDGIQKSKNYLLNGYYKSIAEDNNVIFGGYCWKVIRKTDDDNIRMIYNGLPQDGQCTKIGTDTQIDISKFSTSYNVTDYNNSTVKIVVDSWYNTNLATNYADKISNVDLITSLEASTVGGGYLVSGQSYWTQTPSGENATTTSSCTISHYYNSMSSCSAEPSGEIYSSGIYIVNASGEVVNSNNGVYSGNLVGSCNYCTRGLSGGRCIADSNFSGGCCQYSTYNASCSSTIDGSSLGVRPVITLKNTVTLQGGNGTSSSPYYLN